MYVLPYSTTILATQYPLCCVPIPKRATRSSVRLRRLTNGSARELGPCRMLGLQSYMSDSYIRLVFEAQVCEMAQPSGRIPYLFLGGNFKVVLHSAAYSTRLVKFTLEISTLVSCARHEPAGRD